MSTAHDGLRFFVCFYFQPSSLFDSFVFLFFTSVLIEGTEFLVYEREAFVFSLSFYL